MDLYTKTSLVDAANSILEREGLKLVNERFITDNANNGTLSLPIKQGKEVRYSQTHLEEILDYRRKKKDFGITRKAYASSKSLFSSQSSEVSHLASNGFYSNTSTTNLISGANPHETAQNFSIAFSSGSESPNEVKGKVEGFETNQARLRALAAVGSLAGVGSLVPALTASGSLSGIATPLVSERSNLKGSIGSSVPVNRQSPIPNHGNPTWTTVEITEGALLHVRSDTLAKWSAQDYSALNEVISRITKTK